MVVWFKPKLTLCALPVGPVAKIAPAAPPDSPAEASAPDVGRQPGAALPAPVGKPAPLGSIPVHQLTSATDRDRLRAGHGTAPHKGGRSKDGDGLQIGLDASRTGDDVQVGGRAQLQTGDVQAQLQGQGNPESGSFDLAAAFAATADDFVASLEGTVDSNGDASLDATLAAEVADGLTIGGTAQVDADGRVSGGGEIRYTGPDVAVEAQGRGTTGGDWSVGANVTIGLP